MPRVVSGRRRLNMPSASFFRGMPRAQQQAKKNQLAIAQLKNKIFNMAELKYFCRELSLSPGSAGLGPYDLNLIPEGDGEGQRIGDSVSPKSLVMRFNIIGADATNTVRVIVSRVKGRTGDLSLSDYPIAATTNMATLGCYTDKKMQYNVLFDKTYTVIGDAGAGSHGLHKTVVLKGLGGKIRWDTDTPADTESGGLALMVISDSEAVSHPTFYFSSQLSYTDV